jgi:hypothetical protein
MVEKRNNKHEAALPQWETRHETGRLQRHIQPERYAQCGKSSMIL